MSEWLPVFANRRGDAVRDDEPGREDRRVREREALVAAAQPALHPQRMRAVRRARRARPVQRRDIDAQLPRFAVIPAERERVRLAVDAHAAASALAHEAQRRAERGRLEIVASRDT